jgi:type III pantothenate kinase
MLLAIDVGNTNIVLGVFDGGRLAESWRLATLRERTSDELGILVTHLFAHSAIPLDRVSGIILSSVVPPLTRTMEEMAERYFGHQPLTVDPGTNTGMPVLYTPASDVGADRVVNGVAAYEAYGRKKHAPVIVVDFGTATTFDVVTSRGEYAGGVIAPGLMVSADALYHATAKLPRVEIARPKNTIGRNTVASIQSGLVFGYAGLVDAIVTRIQGEVDFQPRVVGTGGLAPLIAAESKTIQECDDMLTLRGLALIYERNR